MEPAKYGVDDVVTFSPRVTGGTITAKVIDVFYHAGLFGYSYAILITDGNRTWPTGVTECVAEDMLD